MNEPTEREKKMLSIIADLTSLLNVYVLFFDNQTKGVKWVFDQESNMHWMEKQDALMDYLNKEFALDYKKVEAKEITNESK